MPRELNGLTLNLPELCSALQTKIVGGQENALVQINAFRFYEVQKCCPMTGHVWDGNLVVANAKKWETVSKGLQAIITRNFEEMAVEQRVDTIGCAAPIQFPGEATGLRPFLCATRASSVTVLVFTRMTAVASGINANVIRPVCRRPTFPLSAPGNAWRWLRGCRAAARAASAGSRG